MINLSSILFYPKREKDTENKKKLKKADGYGGGWIEIQWMNK